MILFSGKLAEQEYGGGGVEKYDCLYENNNNNNK